MSNEPLEIIDHLKVRLPEHELLLSFENDSGSEKFLNWWWNVGKELFDKYCEEGEFE